MDKVVERCAGLDVHKDTVVATVRVPGEHGRRDEQTHTFGTFTSELLALRDWLSSWNVTLVAMEATGVYWTELPRFGGRCSAWSVVKAL
jgi:transposase